MIVFLPEKIWKVVSIFILSCAIPGMAQRLLDKPVNVTADRQPLGTVLQTLSEQNGFYFSYNSAIIPGDSLITLTLRNETLRYTLSRLLGPSFRYKETGSHVIIQKAEVREKYSYITGTVYDAENAGAIAMASIYSRTRLIAAISDDDGAFRLRVKENAYPLDLTVSRIGYADTLISIPEAGHTDLQIALRIKPVSLDEVLIYPNGGERTWFARHFVSRSLREQARNLGAFFVSLPYQLSLTPGLSTQGRMSTQITNKLSINIIGGYTAGVNGIEVASTFNISRRNVRYLQLSGMFNIVSGSVTGLQATGIHNQVLDSLNGVQASGLVNLVRGNMEGVQLAGGLNRTVSEARGVQVAGVGNVAKQHFAGVQLAGGLNMASERMKGLQVGVVNIAQQLKGVQIGVVNIADSSAGYSIGVVNIIRNGKGELGITASDLAPVNLTWKTGTRRLYSFLTAGASLNSGSQAYVWGLGLGKEFRFAQHLSSAAELGTHTAFAGNWEHTKNFTRLQALLQWDMPSQLRLYAGPALSFDFKRGQTPVDGYAKLPSAGYPHFDFGRSGTAWLGWQAGLSWRYGTLF